MNNRGIISVLYAALLVLLGVMVWLLYQSARCPSAGPEPVRTVIKTLKAKDVAPLRKNGQRRGRFALVIDDVGPRRDLSGFLDLQVPITFAIMPFERNSRAIAADLSARKMPFLLHMPMEPESYPANNPGDRALFVSLSESEIWNRLTASLKAVPGAAGVSNHMGSRFTADADKMRMSMEIIKARNLFFFDSATTPKSKVRSAARSAGVPCLSNDLFVDLQDDPAFMDRQLSRILKKLERGDTVIAIGHVHKKNMVPALAKALPRFREAGVEFVYLTDLLPEHTDVVAAR